MGTQAVLELHIVGRRLTNRLLGCDPAGRREDEDGVLLGQAERDQMRCDRRSEFRWGFPQPRLLPDFAALLVSLPPVPPSVGGSGWPPSAGGQHRLGGSCHWDQSAKHAIGVPGDRNAPFSASSLTRALALTVHMTTLSKMTRQGHGHWGKLGGINSLVLLGVLLCSFFFLIVGKYNLKFTTWCFWAENISCLRREPHRGQVSPPRLYSRRKACTSGFLSLELFIQVISRTFRKYLEFLLCAGHCIKSSELPGTSI